MDPRDRIELSDLDRILDSHIAQCTREELIPLSEAVRRVSARDIYSDMDIPNFRRSQVDGYAVRGASPWTLVRSQNLESGECVEVQSGGKVPEGTERVVKYRHCEVEGDRVVFVEGEDECFIDERGSDTRRGELLVQRGELLTLQRIAIMASTGVGSVWVRSRPEVYIIVTGEEVKVAGVDLDHGDVYDSTSVVLKAFVERLGGKVREVLRVGDSLELLKAAIASIFPNVDLVLTIGGSSIGATDKIREYVERWGELVFHGMDVRPARPVLMGVIEGVPLLGFPGFTTSTSLMTQILLPKVMARLTGTPELRPKGRTVRLGETYRGYRNHIRILPGRVEEGRFYSTFISSSAVSSFSDSDGYIVLDKGVVVEEGSEVQFCEYL